MVQMDFGGVKETVVTRNEFTVEQAKQCLKMRLLQYWAMAFRGVHKPLTCAIMESKSLLDKARCFLKLMNKLLKTAGSRRNALLSRGSCKRGTINVFADRCSTKRSMAKIKDFFKEGDALYFSHGFSIVYGNMTGVIPPKNIDVILVAPKGSGNSVGATL